MTYTIELTEKQISIVETALEEWFRLRMGQDMDFCNYMASINCDFSAENPKRKWIFDMYLARRDHMSELMKAVFRIAFEPTGYLEKKTDDMLVAEDIWDSIRCARGRSRWGKPLNLSEEPMPKVVRHEAEQ